jgi:hypothetical protein
MQLIEEGKGRKTEGTTNKEKASCTSNGSDQSAGHCDDI